MMNSSISLVCMLIEVVISIMHATPYINIELWLVRRRRFPAGIWFEIVSCHGSSDNPPEIVSLDTIGSPSKNSLHLENISGRSHDLVSILHSNFLTVGFQDHISLKSAYGVLTGKRISSTFATKLPLTMPWMFIPFKEYWCVFRNSTCKPECDCHLLQ
ncbi:hypothetical protein AB3S75_031403 [Citrus x aurantiifolia]